MCSMFLIGVNNEIMLHCSCFVKIIMFHEVLMLLHECCVTESSLKLCAYPHDVAYPHAWDY